MLALDRVRAVALIAVLALPLALQAEETVNVKAKDISLNVPKSWKQQQLSSNFRLAQFAIDPVEGDSEPAELVVSGPFGGTVAANIGRWVEQFEATGRAAKMTQGKCEQGTYILADLTGTYKKPDGPPMAMKTKPAPGYKMIGVMLQTPDHGNFFLKLTGPEKTVAAAAEALRQSIGASAEKETPYEAN
ncbi:hypothetical protein [Planctomicrobium sp. SH664]|uniref:hypothetical protein n=1 Tax=Planctomicrobium sp. SH664 TaxID=3448125 RepID=UPI003F5B2723